MANGKIGKPNQSTWINTHLQRLQDQVSKKEKIKRKNIPQRTCVGCRTVQPKRSLIRIVRTPEGVQVDPTGKIPGRGAYLHELHSCWETGIKGSLTRSLKTDLTSEDLDLIKAYMETLPVEALSEGGSGK